MMRRRQSAAYSPGGCGCGLLLLPVIAVSIGMMFALAGLAAAAFVLLIIAIGVTIWLYRCREQRRADGKTNVGWVVFPAGCRGRRACATVYRSISSQLMNSNSILPTMCCVPAR